MSAPGVESMIRSALGDFLDLPVRDVMRAGVVSIAEDASLHQVYRAIATHHVHAVLVVGSTSGRALGWITARGLFGWLTSDQSLSFAREAITERPVTIAPSDSVRDAVTALSQPGTTHLLVARNPDWLPEGVISDLDVVSLASP
jgi:CBS domain-containing protein